MYVLYIYIYKLRKEIQKMDLRISLLNFNFFIIYTIHKLLILIKIT